MLIISGVRPLFQLRVMPSFYWKSKLGVGILDIHDILLD